VLDPDIGILIVAGMAMLLTSASLHKWRELPQFELVLRAYRVVPDSWVIPLTRLIPTFEFAIAAGFAFPATRSRAALAGAALLLSYGGGIAINLWRDRLDLDCGCAGPGFRRPIAPWMVVRNVVLAALLVSAAVPWATRPLALADSLTVGGGLAVVTFLYLSIDRLLGQIVPRGAALRRRL
jgi:Methylamine utilisation protein MauE